MDLNKIKIGSKAPEEFQCVIEIMGGVLPVKYEIDKDSGALFVDRFVSTAMYYPCDYGFIPETLAEDGDPLDVLLISNFSVVPGAVIKVRPVGVLRMSDEKGVDEKVLCVPVNKVSPFYSNVKSYKDLPESLVSQIKHFFENYKALEAGKWVKVTGIDDEVVAKQIIQQCILRYKG